VNAVENGLERRVLHSLAEDVQRLGQWHAGLEQRGELLVEDDEFLAADAPAAGRGRPAGDPASGLKGEYEEALLLEITT
jgi:hypothetical protein